MHLYGPRVRFDREQDRNCDRSRSEEYEKSISRSAFCCTFAGIVTNPLAMAFALFFYFVNVLHSIDLLGTIGAAQMEEQIKKVVMDVVKEQERTMIESERSIPSSLSEEDLTKYMEQVIKETKMQKKGLQNKYNDQGHNDL
jgi:hypothetical protein